MTFQRGACPIGGEWLIGDAWIHVDDPATGTIIGRVPDLGPRHIEQAIAAAEQAFPAWAARPAGERASILRRYHDLIIAHRDPDRCVSTA